MRLARCLRTSSRRAAMRPAGRVIITGGPGAGKTSLLDTLMACGYCVVEESARAIIRERLAGGLSPRPGPWEFAAEVMRRDMAKYRQKLTEPGWVFFDRGIPDGMCMLDQVVPLGRRKIALLHKRFAYHRQVFILPPWEAIYRNDAERDQTFADAIRVFGMLRDWYLRCGYEVVEVPPMGTAGRCEFVLKTLSLVGANDQQTPIP